MSEIVFTADANAFRLSAVKKAAYRLGDRCFVSIEVLSEGGIQVRLTAKSAELPLTTLEGEFRNELLDQELRESIAEQTEGVRKLLLAQAFSCLAVADPVADAADYRDDPLDIARSQRLPH